MKRRDVLRTGVGAVGVSVLGRSVAGESAQSSDEFEPLGFEAIEGTAEVAVDEAGEIAYVAAGDGFATVDLSDPAEPTVLAERRDLQGDHPDGPLLMLHDCKVEGDRMVICGPAFQGPSLQGMLLYDVTDPAEPVELAFHETDFPIHNAFILDGYVYLTANDDERRSMVIVDARDDEPEAVAEWSLTDHDDRWVDVYPDLRFIHDIWVQDGIAYVAHWDAGTWLVDVGDPSAPESISRFGPHGQDDLVDLTDPHEISAEFYALPGNDHYVTVDEAGAVLAVGREAWAVEEAETDEPGENVGADSDGKETDARMETDARNETDAGDETNAGESGRLGGPGGIELWDVSDPAAPAQLSTIEPPVSPDPTRTGVWMTAHNCWFDEGLLYTSWYEGGVKVHDVTDPSDPIELASWADPDRASLWRAHGAVTDEFFVASSHDVEGAGFDQGIFTFPDVREGETATPTAASTHTEPVTTTGQPGFDFGALAGLGVGTWWLSRRRR